MGGCISNGIAFFFLLGSSRLQEGIAHPRSSCLYATPFFWQRQSSILAHGQDEEQTGEKKVSGFGWEGGFNTCVTLDMSLGFFGILWDRLWEKCVFHCIPFSVWCACVGLVLNIVNRR